MLSPRECKPKVRQAAKTTPGFSSSSFFVGVSFRSAQPKPVLPVSLHASRHRDPTRRDGYQVAATTIHIMSRRLSSALSLVPATGGDASESIDFGIVIATVSKRKTFRLWNRYCNDFKAKTISTLESLWQRFQNENHFDFGIVTATISK
jgi:hypothetical protein